MIKFSYKADGEIKVVEFDKYYSLLRFVATNRIADEDFVAMDLNADNENSRVIEGLDGLVEVTLETADQMEEAERMMEQVFENCGNGLEPEYSGLA